jgi:hypothetical protein
VERWRRWVRETAIEEGSIEMGVATDVTAALTRVPVSVAESEERREAARVRDDLTTTLDGSVVERVAPTVAAQPVRSPQPSTWD